MGKAKAMMFGFDLAKQLGYPVVIMLDGDGQHNPAEIPRVAQPVIEGKADLVIGSRFMEEESDIPYYRQVGQTILTASTNLTVSNGGFKPTDSQSGFRALSAKAMDNLNFRSEGYSIESDMIAHFAAKELRMMEVPIGVRYNVPHKHKKNPISHGMDVLADIIGFVGYKRPLLCFMLPGGLFSTIGVIAASFAFRDYYLTTRFPFSMSMAAGLTITLGLLLMTTGLILNSLVRIMDMHANNKNTQFRENSVNDIQ